MSADKGYGPAQNNLGAKYAAGEGVPKDVVEAHVWFNLAGVKGNAAALRNLSILERDMSGEQKSLAMDTARKRFSGPSKQPAAATDPLRNSSTTGLEKTTGNIPAALTAAPPKNPVPNVSGSTNTSVAPQKSP
jgi:TPR repeat protein